MWYETSHNLNVVQVDLLPHTSKKGKHTQAKKANTHTHTHTHTGIRQTISEYLIWIITSSMPMKTCCWNDIAHQLFFLNNQAFSDIQVFSSYSNKVSNNFVIWKTHVIRFRLSTHFQTLLSQGKYMPKCFLMITFSVNWE